MRVPQVAIIGRPNVGKSSIFNWMAGHRIAIVDDVAGVTRDRMSHLMQVDEHFFDLVDTGGIGINDVDNLTKEIVPTDVSFINVNNKENLIRKAC